MQAYIKASNGQRFLAFLIDAILIAGAAFGLMFAVLAIIKFDFARFNELTDKIYDTYFQYMRTGNDELLKDFNSMATEYLKLYFTRVGIYYAMVALIILLYLVVLPYFWQYQTLGRLFAKVKIISRDNNLTPSFGRLAFRELVGTFIFYYLINSVLLLISGILCLSSNKSLVDMLSRTELVYYKPVEVNQHTLFGDQDEDYYNNKFGKRPIDAEFKEVNDENNNDNLNQNQNDNVDNNLNNNTDNNNQENGNKIVDGDDEYQVF